MFVGGAIETSIKQWSINLQEIFTHSDCISATLFPVSKTDEIRLFAKTSGETSVSRCSVARSRRALASDRINDYQSLGDKHVYTYKVWSG